MSETILTSGSETAEEPSTSITEFDEVFESTPTEEVSAPEIVLSEQQTEAVSRIENFMEDDTQEFRLGGYAGTGKTTLIKYLLARLKTRSVYVVAFTGKAVSVLHRKGIPAAMTLHSLMYETRFDSITRKLVHTRREAIYADLVIVDEASMISTELYEDLAGYGIKMLFVGDPGQLEPVGDNPDLMELVRCHYVLDEIHRQARNSPILRLATAIRTGTYGFQTGTWGGLTITKQPDALEAFQDVDVTICGRNNTRHRVNTLRRFQRGITTAADGVLTVGEAVVCLKNNREFGVSNGMTFRVTALGPASRLEARDIMYVDLEDDLGQEYLAVPMALDCFGVDMKRATYRRTIPFDYAYALTAHKSQGSEWRKVLVIDEPLGYNSDSRRWRYTSCTRASEELIYLL